MYSSIHTIGRRFIGEEIPSGVASLAIAEMFYEFHSFTLECLAFLATWYVLSLVQSLIGIAIFGKGAP